MSPERASIANKLRVGKARRDEVVGATARERIESEIESLAVRDENLERRITALESREDEVYRKWRDRYHELNNSLIELDKVTPLVCWQSVRRRLSN